MKTLIKSAVLASVIGLSALPVLSMAAADPSNSVTIYNNSQFACISLGPDSDNINSTCPNSNNVPGIPQGGNAKVTVNNLGSVHLNFQGGQNCPKGACTGPLVVAISKSSSQSAPLVMTPSNGSNLLLAATPGGAAQSMFPNTGIETTTLYITDDAPSSPSR